MNNDFSWESDSKLQGSEVPDECWPTRFALTAPQCVVKGRRELLLVDPHASGTWETWMFPYASLVLTRDEVSERIQSSDLDVTRTASDGLLTFDELASLLTNLRRRLVAEYEESIRTEVNNALPGIGSAWRGEPFYENYSLKFSKTSGSYTAYVFEYYMNDVDELAVDLPHLWVPLDDLDHLRSAEQLESKLISSNVREAIPAVLAAIASR